MKGHFREKSNRKSGGQKGHRGSTLKMNGTPDEIQKYIPKYWEQCGEEFNENSIFEFHKRKQEIVIPPIRPRFIEHQSYRYTLS